MMDYIIRTVDGKKRIVSLPYKAIPDLYKIIKDDEYLLYRNNDRDVIINAEHIVSFEEK